MSIENKRLSFEFFPNRTEQGLEKLINTCEQLQTFNPEFFSVTYGAGGSTRDNTMNVVKTLRAKNLNSGHATSSAPMGIKTKAWEN